jgi:hypothetical protein
MIIRLIKPRRMRWAGHVACVGEKRNMYRVLVGKPEIKRQPGRRRRGWENGIRMGRKEGNRKGCRKPILCNSECRRLVDCREHGNEHHGPIKCGKFLD